MYRRSFIYLSLLLCITLILSTNGLVSFGASLESISAAADETQILKMSDNEEYNSEEAILEETILEEKILEGLEENDQEINQEDAGDTQEINREDTRDTQEISQEILLETSQEEKSEEQEVQNCFVSIDTNKEEEAWEYYSDPVTLTVSTYIIRDPELALNGLREIEITLDSENAYMVDHFPNVDTGILSVKRVNDDTVLYTLDNSNISDQGLNITIGYKLNGRYLDYSGILSPAGILSDKLLDNPDYQIKASVSDTSGKSASVDLHLKKDNPENFISSHELVNVDTALPVAGSMADFKANVNGNLYIGNNPNTNEKTGYLIKLTEELHTPIRSFRMDIPLPEGMTLNGVKDIYISQGKNYQNDIRLEGSGLITSVVDGSIGMNRGIYTASVDANSFLGLLPQAISPFIGINFNYGKSSLLVENIAAREPGIYEADAPVSISYQQLVSDGEGGYRVDDVVKELETIKIEIPEFNRVPALTQFVSSNAQTVSEEDTDTTYKMSFVNKASSEQIESNTIPYHHPSGRMELHIPEELDLTGIEFSSTTIWSHIKNVRYTIQDSAGNLEERVIEASKTLNFSKTAEERVTNVVFELKEEGFAEPISSYIGFVGTFSRPDEGQTIAMPITLSSSQGEENLIYKWTYTENQDNLKLQLMADYDVFLNESTKVCTNRSLNIYMYGNGLPSKEYHDLEIEITSKDALGLKLLSDEIKIGMTTFWEQQFQITGEQTIEYTTNLHPEIRTHTVTEKGVKNLNLGFEPGEYYTSLKIKIDQIKLSNAALVLNYINISFNNKRAYMNEQGEEELIGSGSQYSYEIKYHSPQFNEEQSIRESTIKQKFITVLPVEIQASVTKMEVDAPATTARGDMVGTKMEINLPVYTTTYLAGTSYEPVYQEGTKLYYKINPNFIYLGIDERVQVKYINGSQYFIYNLSGLPVGIDTNIVIPANSFYCMPTALDNTEYEILSEGYLDIAPQLLADKEAAPYYEYIKGTSIASILEEDTAEITKGSGIAYNQPRLFKGYSKKTMVIASSMSTFSVIAGKGDYLDPTGIKYTAQEHDDLTAKVLIGSSQNTYEYWEVRIKLPVKDRVYNGNSNEPAVSQYSLRLREHARIPEGLNGSLTYMDDSGTEIEDFKQAAEIIMVFQEIPIKSLFSIDLKLSIEDEETVYRLEDKSTAGIYVSSSFCEISGNEEVWDEEEKFAEFMFQYYQVEGMYFTESESKEPDGIYNSNEDWKGIEGSEMINFVDLTDESVYHPIVSDDGTSYTLRLPPKKMNYKLAPDISGLSGSIVLTKQDAGENEKENSSFPRDYKTEGINLIFNTSKMSGADKAMDFKHLNLGIYINPTIILEPIRLKVGESLSVDIPPATAQIKGLVLGTEEDVQYIQVEKINGASITIKGVKQTLSQGVPVYKNAVLQMTNSLDDIFEEPLTYQVYGEKENLSPVPYIHKDVTNLSRNSEKAHVGDMLEYTIIVKNSRELTLWSQVEVTDVLPIGLDFTGMVNVDGMDLPSGDFLYEPQSRTLKIPVGDLYGGSENEAPNVKVIKIICVINEKAYGTELINTATASGLSSNQVEGSVGNNVESSSQHSEEPAKESTEKIMESEEIKKPEETKNLQETQNYELVQEERAETDLSNTQIEAAGLGEEEDDEESSTDVQGFIKAPINKKVYPLETVEYIVKGFENTSDISLNKYTITDIIPEGINFKSAKLPAFTNAKGLKYDISYTTNKSRRKVIHKNISAEKVKLISAPEVGEGEYITGISVEFDTVSKNFGINDSIIFSFIVDKQPPATRLVNRAMLSYNQDGKAVSISAGIDKSGIRITGVYEKQIPITANWLDPAKFLMSINLSGAGILLYSFKKRKTSDEFEEE
jgi:fimbrial isopeptide formation D2 family protein/uncharacterized repeat protein (TIGR01451 family)